MQLHIELMPCDKLGGLKYEAKKQPTKIILTPLDL